MKIFLLFIFIFTLIGINYAYGYGEVSATDFRVVNSLGEDIKSPVVEQQLNLQMSLKNISTQNTDWAYIVQIIDANGAIVDLNYATGSLVNNQTLTAALSWTPHISGTYKIETFIWDNLRDIDPLAPMTTSTITVT
ncbi:MAG TPA: hypothetical protein VEJ68_04480 [Candidatus Bathyarchaeia archaeon]|nr:hypothetical protein [Candidatus Bathyarchaeia archaeon]